jgi:hypothetical protein
LTGLLDGSKGIDDLVDLAIASEFGQACGNDEVVVRFGILGEAVTHATVLVDDEVFVVFERSVQEAR